MLDEERYEEENGEGVVEDDGTEIPAEYWDYALEDAKQLPESLNVLPDAWKNAIAFNKEQFSQIVHKHGLTKAQAKGLWEDYQNATHEEYLNQYGKEQARQSDAMFKQQQAEEKREEVINRADGLHPTKEEAQYMIDKIVADKEHPYLNDSATPFERAKAVAFVDRLYSIVAGTEVSIEGYYADFKKDQVERLKTMNDGLDYTDEGRSSRHGEHPPEQPLEHPDNIGTGEKETHSASGRGVSDMEE